MSCIDYSAARKLSLLAAGILFLIFPSALKAQQQKSTPVKEQKSAIIITADQPNVWTLEQAHYLLAQMHRRNLDLKASPLDSLDANAINGVNIDVLKTLLEVSAEYDQAKAINNSIRLDQRKSDSVRRQELIKKRSDLQDQSLALTRQIAELEILKLKAQTEEEKNNLQRQIEELTIVQTAVKAQIDQITTEMGTLSSVTGDFERFSPSTTEGFDKSKFSGNLDDAFNTSVKSVLEGFNKSPQLNASLRLENYLQMQYEILSKQLTLLRDEVGPGERLLFLEMPQSIRASYDKADNKWAQSWWKIRAYTTCEEIRSGDDGVPDALMSLARRLSTLRSDLDSFVSNVKDLQKAEDPVLKTRVEAAKEKLKVAETLVNDKADLGRKILDSLKGLNTNPDDKIFDAEILGARGKLNTIFRDALKTANTAARDTGNLILVEKMRFEDALLASVQAPQNAPETPAAGTSSPPFPRKRPSKKRKILQTVAVKNVASQEQTTEKTDHETIDSKQIVKEFERLETLLADARNGEFMNAHAVWLKFKIRAVESIAFDDFSSEVAMALRETGASYNNETMVRRIISLPTPKGQKSCENIEYKDTASVLKELIEGDNSRRSVGVVDLDEQIGINSPLKKLFSKGPFLENREARIVDLFPRQSSLNVNDVKLRSHALSLRFLFSIISGFGAKANYQRSRERYSQFVQQELYSSAFGKGSREFGWTFNPMPGTKRVMSGVRTTYAIMIVPEKATTIVLQSTGCYFSRAEKQLKDFENALRFHEEKQPMGKGNCSESRSFLIPIATAIATNSFWVDKIEYQPAEQGRRVVVSIKGKDFSTQVGVLVDGVALKPALGLGQPFIVDDSKTNAAITVEPEIKGSFERVDSSQIIASFEMGKEYKERTPTITLIAPGKGIVLNTLNGNQFVEVNGDHFPNLRKSPNMFGKTPVEGNPKIETVRIFRKSPTDTKTLIALIAGANFTTDMKVDVNGVECTKDSQLNSTKLFRCEFQNIGEKKMFFTLIDKNTFFQSGAIDNPITAVPPVPEAVTGHEIKPAEFSVDEVIPQPDQPKPDSSEVFVVVKLKGKGFPDNMRADNGIVQVINSGEALFKIERSKSPLVVTFFNDGINPKDNSSDATKKFKFRKEISGAPQAEPGRVPRRGRPIQ